MSAYGKPPPPQLHGNGYDSSRTFPESAFAYAAPIYGQSTANSTAPSSAFPEAPPMAYASSQPRSSYDEQAAPYLSVGSTPTPVVKDFSPQRGGQGTRVQVVISTIYELLTSNEPTFFLVFGQTKVPALLTKTDQQGSICQYSVTADVPQLAATGWTSSQIPVSMFMESGDGDVIAKVDVGNFSYADGSGQASAQDNPRKRKHSLDTTEMNDSNKRLSGQHIRPKEDFGQYGAYAPSSASSYTAYLQPGTGSQSSQYATVPPYPRSGSLQTQNRNTGYSFSGPTSPPNVKAQTAQMSNWGSSYPSLTSNARSPGIPSGSGMSRPDSSLPSPGISANPPLIRTSRLPQSPSPANTPLGGVPYGSFAQYHHRAKLEIKGDLDAMTVNWSPDEWEARRRLVVFKRSQLGSTITTTFKPTTPEERPPHSICVSCILWEEKKEYFITSVDTISLLEQLVAARFTVEEKNRIRRNLEGFRPMTVSKAKPDSEAFFRVIMDFPPPKPRNIEKDVKVFYWKDLTSALKKIISKYSASPSSTLPPGPALMTPVSSTGYATESSNLSYANDNHGLASPRSISATSTVYNSNPNLQSRISPHAQKSIALQGSSDMRGTLPHAHESPQWQGGHNGPGSQYQHLGNQAGRGWDISSNYLESPTTAGNPNPSQNLNFTTPRGADLSDGQGDSRRLSTSRIQSQQMPRT